MQEIGSLTSAAEPVWMPVFLPSVASMSLPVTSRRRCCGLQLRKIAALSTSAGSVQLRLVPAEEVSSLRTDGPFDGALSNFGAVNCVSDVGKLARDLARLLKPGASLLLCVIGPSCAWETAWYLLHGKPAQSLSPLPSRWGASEAGGRRGFQCLLPLR